jgi:S-methylmethionine-dependent homocysteine/selenocysteine methylase
MPRVRPQLRASVAVAQARGTSFVLAAGPADVPSQSRVCVQAHTARMTVVLLDGPMGTELVRRGVPAPSPAWSAHALDAAPEVVASIHRDYAVAGATLHTANTFRTSQRTVGERWEELARRAVGIARGSVPAGCRVAGSIAPLEDCYRPDLSPGRAARPAHAELSRVLADAGVDVLLCETFPHPVEAAVAVGAAVSTGIETWVALTAGPDASLMTPNRMREAARACAEEGARAVLVNCTPAMQTLRYVEALAGVGVGFGAYANAGSAEDRVGWGADADEGAARYAALARAWSDAGATILGGCCGTGPAHIAALASGLEAAARQK